MICVADEIARLFLKVKNRGNLNDTCWNELEEMSSSSSKILIQTSVIIFKRDYHNFARTYSKKLG